MQRQRFENKYIMPEALAAQVREFVAAHLELDENGVGKPNYSYPVHSLYPDGGQLDTYWMTINGDKNRFKLRLRFYNDKENTPVFFEIKRRMNNCMIKQRGGVWKSAVPAILAGQAPSPDMMISQDPKHLFAVQRFMELMQRLRARPKAHVAYLREAYIHPDHDDCRVTFDRDVRVEARTEAIFTTDMVSPAHPFAPEVILELKFANRYPDWFRSLVRHFNLLQCGAAKYCEGIDALGGLLQPATNGWHAPTGKDHLLSASVEA